MEEEIWRDVVGYENHYMVSNYGNIKNTKTNNTLKGCRDINGYVKVTLHNGKCNTSTVHRLVGLAFIPNPEGYPIIHHKDENSSNNRVDNLEWVTVKQNANHGTRNERISNVKKEYICEYDLEGNLLRIWNNSKHIKDTYNVSLRAIQLACKEHTISCETKRFRYFSDTRGENIEIADAQHIHKAKCGRRSHINYEDVPIDKNYLIHIDDIKEREINLATLDSTLNLIKKNILQSLPIDHYVNILYSYCTYYNLNL